MDDSQAFGISCDPQRMLVMSLKPRFAGAILSGDKTVELRRTEPRIKSPTRALIYASTPTRSLVGQCIVYQVHRLTLPELWQQFGPQTAISQQEFLNYFDGTDTGVALLLSDSERFSTEVPLAELRQSIDQFQAPQSFSYVTSDAGARLLAMAS